MVQAHPNTEALDAFLREVVQTIHTATGQGMRHLEDDPTRTNQAIQDCTDIIGQIMDGDVKSWLE